MPQNFGLACLVLAAGGGSRLGGGKLLLPWRGEPLALLTLRIAKHPPDLLALAVVIGHEAKAMRRVLEQEFSSGGPPIAVVENPRWREGQSSSLQCGLAALLASPEGENIDALLVMLGDQPLVKPATIAALVAAHAAARAANPGHPATAPVHQGKRGNPVILSRTLFPDVMALRGDVGARNILAALGEHLLLVSVDDPGVLRDIDTPDDYAALREQPEGGSIGEQ